MVEAYIYTKREMDDVLAGKSDLERQIAELRAAIAGKPMDPSVTHGQFVEMAQTLHAACDGGRSRAEAAEAKLAKVEAERDHWIRENRRILAAGQDAAYRLDGLSAELAEAQKQLDRASILVRLVTVRQVIDAGDRAIEASGLNPWCMNEGLADGSERISASFLASKEASHAE